MLLMCSFLFGSLWAGSDAADVHLHGPWEDMESTLTKSEALISTRAQESPRGDTFDMYWSGTKAAERACFIFQTGSDDSLRSLAQHASWTKTCLDTHQDCMLKIVKLGAVITAYISRWFLWGAKCGGRGCSIETERFNINLGYVLGIGSVFTKMIADFQAARRVKFCNVEKVFIQYNPIYTPASTAKIVADVFSESMKAIDLLNAVRKRECELKEDGYLLFSSNKDVLAQLTLWVGTLIMFNPVLYKPDDQLLRALYLPLSGIKDELLKERETFNSWEAKGVAVARKQVAHVARRIGQLSAEQTTGNLRSATRRFLTGSMAKMGTAGLKMCWESVPTFVTTADGAEGEGAAAATAAADKSVPFIATTAKSPAKSSTWSCKNFSIGMENTIGGPCIRNALPDSDRSWLCCEDDQSLTTLIGKGMKNWKLRTAQIFGPPCLVWQRWKTLEDTYRIQRRKEVINLRMDRFQWLQLLFGQWQGVVLEVLDTLQEKTTRERNCLKLSFILAGYIASIIDLVIDIVLCARSANEPSTWMVQWDAATDDMTEDDMTSDQRGGEVLSHLLIPDKQDPTTQMLGMTPEKQVSLLGDAIEAVKKPKMSVFERLTTRPGWLWTRWKNRISALKGYLGNGFCTMLKDESAKAPLRPYSVLLDEFSEQDSI